MKYEHTHLSVRVTATGNTAREMSRWSNAARTEYLCDQIVMFLNGRRPDFCVECVDLEAERLERVQRRHTTDWDAGQPDMMGSEVEPAPQPVDAGGEWPRWAKMPTAILRLERPLPDGAYFGTATPFEPGGLSRGGKKPQTHRSWWEPKHSITPTQAAKWLRENGHAKVADELEGEDRFEPVDVQPRKGDVMQSVREGDRWIALADGVEECTQPNKYRWETRTSDVGSVLTQHDGGGWRILKRGAPSA